MSLQILEQQVPLVAGDDGVVRVRGSRVTLDTIVAVFELGATAEEIAQRYSTLSLADIYTIIGYYLSHKAEAEAYLRDREVERRRVRAEIEARFPPQGIRERLLARRQQAANAASSS